MSNIADILQINTKIESKKLCYYVTAKPVEITELRLTKAYHDIEILIKTLYLPEIKKVYIVWNINELLIPTNFTQIKDFAIMLRNHTDILTKKLVFSIIVSKSNIFNLFFNVFKQYYNPVKPLYLCKTDKDVEKCIHDESSRESFQNISSMLTECVVDN